MQNAESLSAQNAESLSAQNAKSPWCTVQSTESLMPTAQCRVSDVECRVLQSAAETLRSSSGAECRVSDADSTVQIL